MSKVKRKIAIGLIGCVIGSGTFFRLSATEVPSSAEMAEMIVNGPQKPFKGHLMISLWSDKETKAEDVNIYYTPPNKYRMEFLTPDGTVDRVVLSNSNQEQTQLLKNDQVVQNYTTDFPPKFIGPKDEKNLLLENYSLSIKEGEKILGRSTWLVEWTPLTPGKPYHQMIVDRETHAVLETKQYFSEGSKNGSLTRFTQFDTHVSFPISLFLPEIADTSRDLTHTISPLDEQRAKDAQLFSKKLTGGFSFESVNYLEVTGKSVKQVRYTDGMIPLSLFQTPIPVKIPENGAATAATDEGVPLKFGASKAGNVCHWEKNKEYFTLIGDVPEPLLQDISRDFR